MNIAVISPHGHGHGTTTVSALVAGELAAQGKKVLLTHTRTLSESIPSYFGMVQAPDSSPQSLVALIQQNTITGDSLPDYCRNIRERLDFFTLDTPLKDGKLTDEEAAGVAEFVLTSPAYDFVIYDVDDDIKDALESPVTSAVLPRVDCVIVVLTQEKVALARFKKSMKKISSILGEVPVITVVNKYDPLLGTKEDVAAEIGIESRRIIRRWQVIRMNHYVQYCENKGKLEYLLTCVHSRRTPEILDVSTDVCGVLRQVTAVRTGIRKIHNRVRMEEED